MGRRKIGQGWLRGLLALMLAGTLYGCADEGAGAYTELLGTWNGSFLLNGVLPLDGHAPSDGIAGTGLEPMAHPASGTFVVTFTQDDPGDVQGTIAATPDLCWNASPFNGAVRGTFSGNRLEFSYTTSNVPGLTVDVILTVPVLNDPVLGSYDGNACGAGWNGGIRMERP